MNSFCKEQSIAAKGCVLRIYVQPGAKSSRVEGMHADELKIRLAAPPVEGAANARLVEFLADLFDLKRNAVELIKGHQSRHKLVSIKGLNCESIRSKLHNQKEA